ncbi:MAG: hypothetical protein QM695_15925 [Micropruina sp.]
MAGVLNQQVTSRWAIYNADALDVMAEMPDASIHASIYSPPFAGLYVYSSNDRDVSNARTTPSSASTTACSCSRSTG